jgi:hypothetical protein
LLRIFPLSWTAVKRGAGYNGCITFPFETSAMPGPHTCPSCDAALPDDAVLCVECGYHLLKQKHLKTRVQKPRARGTRQAWDVGMTPAAQVGLMVVILLVPAGIELARGWEEWWVLLLAPPVALLATLFGYRMILDRDDKGRWLLTRHGWFCFRPTSPVVTDLSEYKALYTDYVESEDGGVYVLELRGERARPVILYQGGNERFAKTLMDTMQYDVGLRIERR